MGGQIAGANARANSAELDETNYSWKIYNLFTNYLKKKLEIWDLDVQRLSFGRSQTCNV